MTYTEKLQELKNEIEELKEEIDNLQDDLAIANEKLEDIWNIL